MSKSNKACHKVKALHKARWGGGGEGGDLLDGLDRRKLDLGGWKGGQTKGELLRMTSMRARTHAHKQCSMQSAQSSNAGGRVRGEVDLCLVRVAHAQMQRACGSEGIYNTKAVLMEGLEACTQPVVRLKHKQE